MRRRRPTPSGQVRSVRRGRGLPAALSVALVLASLTAMVLSRPQPAQAATLPAGFQESVVFSGLTLPTAVRFAPDGGVFVPRRAA